MLLRAAVMVLPDRDPESPFVKAAEQLTQTFQTGAARVNPGDGEVIDGRDYERARQGQAFLPVPA